VPKPKKTSSSNSSFSANLGKCLLGADDDDEGEEEEDSNHRKKSKPIKEGFDVPLALETWTASPMEEQAGPSWGQHHLKALNKGPQHLDDNARSGILLANRSSLRMPQERRPQHTVL